MTDQPIDKSQLLDIDQVAEKLSVSRRTVERAVDRLEIKRRKFRGDRKLYYSPEDLDRIREVIREANPNVEFENSLVLALA